MKTYILTLDLKNDPTLIANYINAHQNVWPEIQESILSSGIIKMDIFNVANRLVMSIAAEDDFSFEKKEALDMNNPVVNEWESLMDNYQERLPFSKPNEKWVLMKRIFELNQSNEEG